MSSIARQWLHNFSALNATPEKYQPQVSKKKGTSDFSGVSFVHDRMAIPALEGKAHLHFSQSAGLLHAPPSQQPHHLCKICNEPLPFQVCLLPIKSTDTGIEHRAHHARDSHAACADAPTQAQTAAAARKSACKAPQMTRNWQRRGHLHIEGCCRTSCKAPVALGRLFTRQAA